MAARVMSPRPQEFLNVAEHSLLSLAAARNAYATPIAPFLSQRSLFSPAAGSCDQTR